MRRTQLLDAAERLFTSRGIDAVTVADIAAAAGVAKGTFYLYFMSRERLLEALMARHAGAAGERLADLAPPDDPQLWPGFLDRIVDEFISFVHDNWPIHDLLATTPHEHVAESGEIVVLDRIRVWLQSAIEHGQSVGAIRRVDPRITAHLLFDLLHAAGHEAGPTDDGVARVGATTRELVRGALLR